MDEQRGVELKMNGNMADLYWMPLEGGGESMYPDSLFVLWAAYTNGMNASEACLSFVQYEKKKLSELPIPFPRFREFLIP